VAVAIVLGLAVGTPPAGSRRHAARAGRRSRSSCRCCDPRRRRPWLLPRLTGDEDRLRVVRSIRRTGFAARTSTCACAACRPTASATGARTSRCGETPTGPKRSGKPASGPFLRCDVEDGDVRCDVEDGDVRCGIDSFFASAVEAKRLARVSRAAARSRRGAIDGASRAALVDLERRGGTRSYNASNRRATPRWRAGSASMPIVRRVRRRVGRRPWLPAGAYRSLRRDLRSLKSMISGIPSIPNRARMRFSM
jgi:hypothetical protein